MDAFFSKWHFVLGSPFNETVQQLFFFYTYSLKNIAEKYLKTFWWAFFNDLWRKEERVNLFFEGENLDF